MAAPFHRSEITAGNVTKQPVLAHEAIASFSGDQQLTIPVSSARVRPPRTAPACSAQRPPPPPHRSPLAPAHLNRRSLRFQPSPTTQPHGGSAGSAERSRTDPRERTGSSPATMPDTPPPRARGAVERPCGERCRSGGPSGPARRERSVSGTWNLGRGKRAWWAGDGHQRVVDQVAPDLGQVCGSSAEGQADRDRSVFPVPVAADIGVGLDGAEDRQHISERPARVAHGRPLVMVLWPSSQREAGVGRRAAAGQAPPRQRNRTPALV